jgi:hypothetical protein
MSATLTRSDILRPLAALLGLLMAFVLLLLAMKAPDWLVMGAGISIFLCVLLYISAYLYCLRSNPDSLRSEKYSLQKLAIEKRLVGDDISGLIPLDEDAQLAGASEESPFEIGDHRDE